MRYDTVIQFKVSIEQRNKLSEYSAKMKKESSVILREYIDFIDKDKNRIMETIDFHKYEQERLKRLLDETIKIEKECEEKEVKINECAKKKEMKENLFNEECKIVFKGLVDKHGAGLSFETEDDKKAKEKEIIAEIKKTEWKRGIDKQEATKATIEKAAIFILNYSEEEVKKVIQSNTSK